MNSTLRRFCAASLALCAVLLPSCASYVADGYYGGAYNAGYCAPASTVYVAPRPYCAPTFYASNYYTPSYYGGSFYGGSCYTPRTYCAPAYSSYGHAHGYSGGHYGGHSHGGHSYGHASSYGCQ